MKNTILVPTDFTNLSEVAIRHAIVFARIYSAEIELLHVVEKSANGDSDAESQMLGLVTGIKEANGIPCSGKILHGSLVDTLNNATCESEQYCLMILPSKSSHGTGQTINGKDTLKLVSQVHTPVMVVQQDSQSITKINKIVLPVASHDSFHKAVDAVMLLAWPGATEIHLYSILKPGFEWPVQLIKNIDDATRILAERQIKMIRVKEEQKVFSPGYAKQTLHYARSINADMICIMSQPSEEYYYIAHADKEAILNNEFHLPILCA